MDLTKQEELNITEYFITNGNASANGLENKSDIRSIEEFEFKK